MLSLPQRAWQQGERKRKQRGATNSTFNTGHFTARPAAAAAAGSGSRVQGQCQGQGSSGQRFLPLSWSPGPVLELKIDKKRDLITSLTLVIQRGERESNYRSGAQLRHRLPHLNATSHPPAFPPAMSVIRPSSRSRPLGLIHHLSLSRACVHTKNSVSSTGASKQSAVGQHSCKVSRPDRIADPIFARGSAFALGGP